MNLPVGLADGRDGDAETTAVAAGGATSPAALQVANEDWARLIRAYHRKVVLSLVATGLSFDRAAELANETWTRLIEKHRSGRVTDLKLPGLAIVQARFLALDERRREVVRAEHREEGCAAAHQAEHLLADRGPTPEQSVLTQQEASRAWAVIAASPASVQRLVKLIYAEPSMPHARAAEAMGLSVERVRHILCELRKKIRAALEGEPS